MAAGRPSNFNNFGAPNPRLEAYRKEFAELDADKNGFVSLEEINAFLSKRSGGNADPNLSRQLFSRMDRNADGKISVDEFITAYAEREAQLESMKRDRELSKNDKMQKLRAQQETLRTLGQERVNQFGLSDGSCLTVTVFAAENLPAMDPSALGSSDPYCVLTCDAQQIETQVKWDTLNPVWNEAFTFQITKPDAVLLVVVMDRDKVGSDDFLGQIPIPLTNLDDQLTHDEWFELKNQNNQVLDVQPKATGRPRIHLGLQWTKSKQQATKNAIDSIEREIAEETRNIDAITAELDALKAPFSILASSGFSAIEKRISDVVAQTLKDRGIESHNVGRFTLYTLCLFFFLSVMANFARPDFFNLCLGAFVLYNMAPVPPNMPYGKWTSPQWGWFALAVLLSEIFDIAWLAVYAAPWTTTADDQWMSSSSLIQSPEAGVQAFAVVMSVANFILKAVFVLPLSFYQYTSTKGNNKGANPNIHEAIAAVRTGNPLGARQSQGSLSPASNVPVGPVGGAQWGQVQGR